MHYRDYFYLFVAYISFEFEDYIHEDMFCNFITFNVENLKHNIEEMFMYSRWQIFWIITSKHDVVFLKLWLTFNLR